MILQYLCQCNEQLPRGRTDVYSSEQKSFPTPPSTFCQNGIIAQPSKLNRIVLHYVCRWQGTELNCQCITAKGRGFSCMLLPSYTTQRLYCTDAITEAVLLQNEYLIGTIAST
jgi:hypothetical protein